MFSLASAVLSVSCKRSHILEIRYIVESFKKAVATFGSEAWRRKVGLRVRASPFSRSDIDPSDKLLAFARLHVFWKGVAGRWSKLELRVEAPLWLNSLTISFPASQCPG